MTEPVSAPKAERPWASPRQEPVKGIVQPRVLPPFGKPTRHTNRLDYILNTTLKEACKHKHVWPFLKPVDALQLGIPHYHERIQRPMDLKTIKNRIKNIYYSSAQECIDDIETVFQNCYDFNGSEDDVTIMAQNVQAVIRKSLESLPSEEVQIESNFGKKKKTKGGELSRLAAGLEDKERRRKEGSSVRGSEPPSECGSEASVDRKMKTTKRKADSDDDEKIEPIRPHKREASMKRPPVVLTGKLKACQKLLNEFYSKKYLEISWPFHEPVDPEALGLHDYLTIVKKPMDMSTIKKKLESGEYTEPSQFAEDYRLMLNNCLLYNPSGDPINELGRKYLAIFEQKWKDFEKSDMPEKASSSASVASTSTSHSSSKAAKAPSSTPAPSVVKHEKPEVPEGSKAKTEDSMRLENALSMVRERETKLKADLRAVEEIKHKLISIKKEGTVAPDQLLVTARLICQPTSSVPIANTKFIEDNGKQTNGKSKLNNNFAYEFDSDSEEAKREMTYEDKRHLSLLINRLPPEHLNTIVSIIERREQLPRQGDDSEIEIDFEALGTLALREMDAFARYILKTPKTLSSGHKLKKEIVTPEKQPMRETNSNMTPTAGLVAPAAPAAPVVPTTAAPTTATTSSSAATVPPTPSSISMKEAPAPTALPVPVSVPTSAPAPNSAPTLSAASAVPPAQPVDKKKRRTKYRRIDETTSSEALQEHIQNEIERLNKCIIKKTSARAFLNNRPSVLLKRIASNSEKIVRKKPKVNVERFVVEDEHVEFNIERPFDMSESSDSDSGKKAPVKNRRRAESGSSSSSSDDSDDDEFQGAAQNRKGGMPPTQWAPNRLGGMGGQPPTARVPPAMQQSSNSKTSSSSSSSQAQPGYKPNTGATAAASTAKSRNFGSSNASKTILDTLLPETSGEPSRNGTYPKNETPRPSETYRSPAPTANPEEDESEAARIERLRTEARLARQREDENSMSLTNQMEMMHNFEFDNHY
ncbi:unnamed protein product [Caenorhabditis bovis]|uniref:Bromodomain-containing protein n=1 Tax=Caenorhabditis bovis TaxID=2654633 RepID=A0A8S1FDX2_9PELO|nr:unnamed protein product [Caenorhabditis bovis]